MWPAAAKTSLGPAQSRISAPFQMPMATLRVYFFAESAAALVAVAAHRLATVRSIGTPLRICFPNSIRFFIAISSLDAAGIARPVPSRSRCEQSSAAFPPHLAQSRSVLLFPEPAQLPGILEATPLGDLFQAERLVLEERMRHFEFHLLCELDQCDPGGFAEEPGQVPRAHRGQRRETLERGFLLGMLDDPVLDSMHSRVRVLAVLDVDG